MKAKEKKFVAYLLSLASDVFANHGCNDLDMDEVKKIGFTQEEYERLAKSFDVWNSGQDDESEFKYVGDASWMHFFADKLEDEADEDDDD